MKRIFFDMDNVLVDFQSGLDQVSEELKKNMPVTLMTYRGYSD